MNTLINYNAQEIKEQVSPVDFLSRLGYYPAYKSGKELFYLSMLREESTPSFCVDDKLGVWYDWGGANSSGIKGGNVIDLALAYWYPLGFKDVLEKINEVCNIEPGIMQTVSREHIRPRKATKIPNYKILEIKELGNNPAITTYLQTRGIWPVAHQHLKEVYYYIEDEKKLRKHFFSAGWKNENGGWEVSNPYFKGCLGPKGLTIISGDSDRVALFEGMTDYLSWKFEQQDDGETVILLNGVTFIEAAIKRTANFNNRTIFFDNDEAGEDASRTFQKAYPLTQNGASSYTGFKDYNQRLVSELDNLYRLPVASNDNRFKAGIRR
ncbi:toprim domain-containing protein [Mucilaginibacter sp.]|uniref:toprim domain-containing protein n=1 Tax=Mucilaginibacter sp. TaxID=1882438 RepID=UPI003D140DB0